MLTITIKKDNYAYFDCNGDNRLFLLLIKSFTRKEKEYNNYYKIWEYKKKSLYSLINNGNTLRVKAGLIPYLCNSLDLNKISYNIIDERKTISENFELVYKLNNNVILRDYQIEAVDNVIKDRFCYVQIPTAGGKTEVAASLIKSFLKFYNKEAILYLVPTKKLKQEAIDRFKEYNIPTNEKLPIIKGEANVLTYASITRATRSKFDYIQRDSIGMFICDEAHHLSANKLSKVIHDLHNLRFSIGLSATPSNDTSTKKYLKELNSKEMLVYGCTGVCSYKLDIIDTIRQNFVTDIEVHVLLNEPENDIGEENDWNLVKNIILKDKNRAIKVAKYVNYILNKANLNTIALLTAEIEFSSIYMKEIYNEFKDNRNVYIFELYGGETALVYNKDGTTTKVTKKQDIDKIYNMIRNPNIITIFSCTSFFYEGINITNLQAIINCYGGRDSKRVKQQVGRCMRLFENKDIAYIHEIKDIGNPVLESQFNKRMEIYTNEYNAKIKYSKF